jgi:hypothetical protein
LSEIFRFGPHGRNPYRQREQERKRKRKDPRKSPLPIPFPIGGPEKVPLNPRKETPCRNRLCIRHPRTFGLRLSLARPRRCLRRRHAPHAPLSKGCGYPCRAWESGAGALCFDGLAIPALRLCPMVLAATTALSRALRRFPALSGSPCGYILPLCMIFSLFT